jgi:2-keto-3-deoxygluconate permease
VLVAVCIIVTSVVVPIITGLWYRKFGRGMAERAHVDDPAPQLVPAD